MKEIAQEDISWSSAEAARQKPERQSAGQPVAKPPEEKLLEKSAILLSKRSQKTGTPNGLCFEICKKKPGRLGPNYAPM